MLGIMALPKTDFEEILAKQKRAEEERDAKRRAEKLSLPYVDLISTKVPTEINALKLVPEKDARAALIAPLQIVRGTLLLAVFDSTLPETKKIISNLQKTYRIQLVIASRTGLEHAWSYYRYIVPEKEISGRVDIDEKALKKLEKETQTLLDFTSRAESFAGARTSDILEAILGGALALHVSDIHIEPQREKAVIRLRLDGLLHTAVDPLSLSVYKSLVTRIKLLSGLKLNIQEEAQDGRFTIRAAGRDIEIRTSVIPSEYGETVVLRVLDPSALKINLMNLGLRPDDLAIVETEIKKPNGIILNTGPTGSGKTTTLYAFLKSVYKPEIKIITIEDPIEYHLEGISQTQVDPESGYTFANGLRSILRQDPDVILVGEIRDGETAGIAMNASLTGHLVFSTLHTNDAVGAVPRLIDLGVKTQVLGPALLLVIAQRLVRLLCSECKTPTPLDKRTEESIYKFIDTLPSRVNRDLYRTIKIYNASGCDVCGGIGYKGRIAIFELFVVTEKIEEAIYRNPTEIELKAIARKEGMVTMQEDGILKVLQGLTSFEEIERLTGPLENLNLKPQ